MFENNLQQVAKKVYLRNELINLRSTLLNIFAAIVHFSPANGQLITNSSSLFGAPFTAESQVESINYNYYTP
jgi:hypothetical protein